MKVRLSRLWRHGVGPVDLIHLLFRRRVGAALCGSLGCVNLHAARFSVEPGTIMPHARGETPIEHDQPATRQSGLTIDEDGRAPRADGGKPAAILPCSERATGRNLSGFGKAPQCDQ